MKASDAVKILRDNACGFCNCSEDKQISCSQHCQSPEITIDDYELLADIIERQEKVVESLKCCGNCDNMRVRLDGFDNFNGYSCGLHGEQYNKKVKRCNRCNKWEALNENNP